MTSAPVCASANRAEIVLSCQPIHAAVSPSISGRSDGEVLEPVVLRRYPSARHVGAHTRRRPVRQCQARAGERVHDVVVADLLAERACLVEELEQVWAALHDLHEPVAAGGRDRCRTDELVAGRTSGVAGVAGEDLPLVVLDRRLARGPGFLFEIDRDVLAVGLRGLLDDLGLPEAPGTRNNAETIRPAG